MKHPIRVGMLAPIAWRTPPRHYGPWELVTSVLTEGLVRRGVDVTLFATGDSLTTARLVAVAPTGYAEDPSLDAKVWEGLHIATCFERAGDFDLIHNQFDFLPLTYTRLVSTPVVTTIHGFSSPGILPAYRAYDDRVHYVSISDADRHPDLDYLATVHHGIELDSFPFRPQPDDYLLFYGRIHPDKGTAAAIEVARRLGQRLLIAGIVQDHHYFGREVEPHLDGTRVVYLGPVGPERRAELLGGAKALLHLIDFEEPFGLSVVEAMACGTPVITFPRGAMPEVVTPGVSGFLVDDLDEAVRAVQWASTLDRRRVRTEAERRFSVERMVDEYLEVYRRVLEG